MLELYSYYRSSASYRVRIALGLKGLEAKILPVNLLKAEQKEAAYRTQNPQGLLPALRTDSGHVLTQSLAIMEYLDEVYPEPSLLPKPPVERARVRALSQAIACEIAPLNNLRVLQYVSQEMGADEDGKLKWMRHWMAIGLEAVETMLADHPQTGIYCHGDVPGMTDCCLVPQIYNAKRFECDLAPYPTIMRIVEACEALPVFQKAHPDNQPDTPKT